jgi:hypothetical protein
MSVSGMNGTTWRTTIAAGQRSRAATLARRWPASKSWGTNTAEILPESSWWIWYRT